MLKFDTNGFIKSLQQMEGAKKIEETEGMKYIDQLLKKEDSLMINEIDFNKFSLEDMDMYRSIYSNIEHLAKEGNKIYKIVKNIEPKMIRKTDYI